MKKGQLTVFMIAGILLLMILGISLLLMTKIASQSSRQDTDINDYVVSCLKLTADEGLDRLGRNGGLIAPQGRYENQTFGRAYYWIKNRGATYPSIEDGMLGLAGYVQDNIVSCLDNFSGSINIGEPSVRCQATAKSVVVRMKLPVSIVTDESAVKRSDFEVILPVMYAKAHSLGEEIVSSRIRHPLDFDLDVLSSAELPVHILTYKEHHVIVITDKNSRVDSRAFRLIFAIERQKD